MSSWDLSAETHVDLGKLAGMPVDLRWLFDAASELSHKDFSVYTRLFVNLVKYGPLPTGYKQLAEIGKVSVRYFERVAFDLSKHFERTAEGRWTIHTIAQARSTRITGQAEDKTKDPVKQASGKRGADSRWSKTKPQPLMIVGRLDRTDGDGTLPSGAIQSMAKPIAETMAKPADVPSADGTLPSFAMPGAIAAPSKLASSLPTEFPKERELASKLEDDPRAGGAMAAGMANTGLFAIVGDGKTIAPVDKPQSAIPARREAADPSPAIEPGSDPSDAAIIEAVVRTCQGKVTKADVHQRLPTYRAWIGEGLGFFEDILPKIESFARKKPRVDNCANTCILADARAHRASRLAAEALAVSQKPVCGEPMKLYHDDPAFADRMDSILAALGWSRKAFCNSDARGVFAYVSEKDWQRAIARVTTVERTA